MTIIGLLLLLIIAGIFAWLAEGFVPGRIPGGFLTAGIVSLIGAWLGANLCGSYGPSLAGISLIPTILASALLVGILGTLAKLFRFVAI